MQQISTDFLYNDEFSSISSIFSFHFSLFALRDQHPKTGRQQTASQITRFLC
jgi:hypothetical protein